MSYLSPLNALIIVIIVGGIMLISNKKDGRLSENDITIFDSTGLFIQDLATSIEILKKFKNFQFIF